MRPRGPKASSSISTPPPFPHAPQRSLNGGHAVLHRLGAVVLGEGHAVCGHVHSKWRRLPIQHARGLCGRGAIGSKVPPRRYRVCPPLRSCIEARRRALQGTAAISGEKEGGLSPARTARIITSQLRGLTHVQGLSVQPVGWLGKSSVRRPRTHVRSRCQRCSADHPRGSQRSSKRATALWSNVIACLHSGSAPDVAGVASGPLAVYLSRRRLLNAAPTGPSGRPKPTNVGHVCGGETSQHASGWVRPTGVGRPSCAAMTPSATSKRAAVLCFSSTRCTFERSRPRNSGLVLWCEPRGAIAVHGGDHHGPNDVAVRQLPPPACRSKQVGEATLVTKVPAPFVRGGSLHL
ncbi:MAG: hypothetical protein CM15mP18_3770 [Methanobacteriota archaeon]|nr:MAG: hypothetical protein CM15mP18_3770 [Euryarchaeota archaeon]